MRIWDIHPSLLCNKHLLGEHRELHGLWNILVYGKSGYSNHPETKRWIGKLPALKNRHNLLVEEMEKRNMKHKSDLSPGFVSGSIHQNILIHTVEEQIKILNNKSCSCKINKNHTCQ